MIIIITEEKTEIAGETYKKGARVSCADKDGRDAIARKAAREEEPGEFTPKRPESKKAEEEAAKKKAGGGSGAKLGSN